MPHRESKARRSGQLTQSGIWAGDPMRIEDQRLRLEAVREQPPIRFPREGAMKVYKKQTTSNNSLLRYVRKMYSPPIFKKCSKIVNDEGEIAAIEYLLQYTGGCFDPLPEGYPTTRDRLEAECGKKNTRR